MKKGEIRQESKSRQGKTRLHWVKKGETRKDSTRQNKITLGEERLERASETRQDCKTSCKTQDNKAE